MAVEDSNNMKDEIQRVELTNNRAIENNPLAVDLSNNSISDSTMPNDSPFQNNTKKVRKLKNMWIWIGLISTAAILALLFVPFIPNPDVPAISQLQPIDGVSTETTKYDSAPEIVSRAADGLGGIVRETTIKYGSYGLDANGLAVYKLPYNALAGKKFSVQPTESYGTAYDGDADQSDVNYQKLTEYFAKNGFSRIAFNEGENAFISEDKNVQFVSYAVYSSKNEICAFWRADLSSITPNTQRVSIGCATMANYEKAADAVEPFYDAYIKSGGKHDTTLVFGAPDILKLDNGYSRAAVYQEDSLGADEANSGKYTFDGIYYKVPNSKKWVYFDRVSYENSEMVECSKINTDVLRKAFSGIGCYDSATKKESKI